MVTKGFDAARSQIGFCGIWCGSCAAGNGAIIELTRRYEELAKSYGLERWAPKDFDFGEFMKGLSSIQAMGLCPGCRKGGGIPKCGIRACAEGMGLNDCSRCGGLDGCKKFEGLEAANPKIKDGLRKLRGAKRAELIEGWTRELRRKWPHCILLCEAVGSS